MSLTTPTTPTTRRRTARRTDRKATSIRRLVEPLLAAACLLSLLVLPTANAQATDAPTSSSSATAASTQAPASTTLSLATATPVALNESSIVRSRLDLNATSGAFFNFTIPASAYSYDNTVRTYVSLSLCDGPEIPPYNITDSALLGSLGLSADDAQASTNVGVYVSSDSSDQRPGPQNSNIPDDRNGFAVGGWASLQVDVRQSVENSAQSIWIGVWPPVDTRNQTSGVYELQLVASTTAALESVDYTQRARLDDTDTANAMFLSWTYQRPSPNLTAIVLPTTGRYSLESISHFNSSFCAISDAWSAIQRSSSPISINTTVTERFTTYNNVSNDVRTQFLISGLQPATNYTTWLIQSEVVNNDTSMGYTYTLFPSFKMVTKRNEFCRLVHDLDFCPGVAYSIPVGPDVSTEVALATINRTVGPNYANFSKLIDTFPCGDPHFGRYSYVQTCDTCKQSYRDWLCSVAMPRCTDTLADPETQSRASQDGRSLTGRPTGENVDLLPYVVNRNASTSRRSYIGDELGAGAYGELLPCIYNCYYVERNCPPLLGWTCPVWDVSAQRDYGTFADSGDEGIGAGMNGGPGSDGFRFGGPQRYISVDGFGNAYCNALGVDIRLRETNSARRTTAASSASAAVALMLVAIGAVLAVL